MSSPTNETGSTSGLPPCMMMATQLPRLVTQAYLPQMIPKQYFTGGILAGKWEQSKEDMRGLVWLGWQQKVHPSYPFNQTWSFVMSSDSSISRVKWLPLPLIEWHPRIIQHYFYLYLLYCLSLFLYYCFLYINQFCKPFAKFHLSLLPVASIKIFILSCHVI